MTYIQRMNSSTQPHFFDGQIATLVEAWSTTINDISVLANALDDDQWSAQSPCPGWTVGDIVAHVVAVERQLAGDTVAVHEPDWSALPHVREDEFSRFMEVGVDARRGSSRADVIDELVDVIPRRTRQLQEVDADPEALVAGPAGSQVPLGRIMRMRAFDLWVHDQDIRTAIKLPGHEAASGAHVSAEILVSTLPMLWGKKVGAQPGQSLNLHITGAISFECTVAIGDGGRANFVDAGADPTTMISTDWLTYVALGAGRVTYDEVQERVTISGDRALALRTLELANIAP